MPRNKRKQNAKKCQERKAVIQAAVKAVHGGQSIRNAAKEFGLPYSTLQEHCTGKQLIKHIIGKPLHPLA